MPFVESSWPTHFVPEVGIIRKPNIEIRSTNNLDYWTISRTNSLGFLDREPISLERAAASCHITVIGDSFVEAKEVSISEKFHIILEEIAAQRLSHLDITVSAFGRGGTGQINQLPYYDEYAQVLNPKLVVLVLHANDFWDNSPIMTGLRKGYDPNHIPLVSAGIDENDAIMLRQPDPDYESYSLPYLPTEELPWHQELVRDTANVSRLVKWIDAKLTALFPADSDPQVLAWAELLSQRPNMNDLYGWRPTTSRHRLYEGFKVESLPEFFEESLEFTAFALDEFQKRAHRDGATLIVLSTYEVGADGTPIFDRLKTMTEALGIPVISQYDHIVRRGGGSRIEEAHFSHDMHWNTAGHRWAAEALLEYISQNQEICDA